MNRTGGGVISYIRDYTERSARIKDIAYLEARGRKVIIHLADGSVDEFYGALKDVYERQLCSADFLFIHASYAVNYDYITELSYKRLSVSGRATPLSISQGRRNEVKDAYAAIVKRRRGR